MKPSSPRLKKSAKDAHLLPQQPSQPQSSKAFLTLKTYDPVSGVCLKYKTDKAAEVGRLVAALGACGRVMAALPARVEPEGDEAAAAEASRVAVPESQTEGKGAKVTTKDGKTGQGKPGGPGGGGGGGKKKKGKK